MHPYITFFSYLLLCLTSVTVHAKWHFHTGSAMGTDIKITFWQPQSEDNTKTIYAVMSEMERVNQLLSPYLTTSELSRVNAHAYTKPQRVSLEFYEMIKAAQEVSRLSDGAFDITFASVGFHYNYRKKQQPSQNTVKTLLPFINYQSIKLNAAEQSVEFLMPHVKIDMGGIAKGYAVDNSIKILKKMGIKHASVSAGGDSYLLGDRAGRPWVTGIKHPRAENENTEQVVLRLPLSDVGVSTSGDYERFFIDEKTGERIHHIINPKTGRSANGIISATILAPSSAIADPLSTAVFILGVKKGLQLVNRLHDIDAIIIDHKGKVFYSDELKPQ